MKRLSIFSTLFLFLSAFTIQTFAQWTNAQPAVSALGQTNFTTKLSGGGNNKFWGPHGIAIDASTGKVFVADLFNDRVLRFTSAQAMMMGGVAEAVLGQPDFATVSSGTTQTKMNFPVSVFVDGGGRLWVGEFGNSRVLRFDNASTIATGAPADGVLGQADFTSGAQGLAQNRFDLPNQLWVDGGGSLWVADTENSRVLRFDNAAAKANGANADGVLGQPDFTSNGEMTSQSGMKQPCGVAVDANGRLWVADTDNNRILRFDNARAKANGANADGVLGQENFNISVPLISQNRMHLPTGLGIDNAKRLYVSDFGNNRVITYDNAATLAFAVNASNVIGQAHFFIASETVAQNRLYGPMLLYFDGATGNLYVGDKNNNRVMRFLATAPIVNNVSISGRVTFVNRFASRAVVSLTDAFGNVKTALVSPLGYYKFENIPAGQNVTIQVTSKGATFAPQVIDLTGDVGDLNFTA